MDELQIVDREGRQQDWAWLTATFGNVQLTRAEGSEGSPVYRVVKLQDRSGPAVQVVNVSDQDGQPLGKVTVVRYWPDAPQLPVWQQSASNWLRQGVFGKTNTDGDIGFGMGQGDYYLQPDQYGVSSVWVADETILSDLISGLGMLGGSDHRHLDVYFRLEEVGPPPEPPPEPLPAIPPNLPPEEEMNMTTQARWQMLLDRLDLLITVLERLVE